MFARVTATVNIESEMATVTVKHAADYFTVSWRLVSRGWMRGQSSVVVLGHIHLLAVPK